MTHRYSCRVRWSDIDGYGHVNNVKFLEYIQEARIAFFADEELTRSFDVVVARTRLRYRRPMLFRHEPYVVETRVTHVGRTSFTIANAIVDPQDADATVASGEVVLVTVDPSTGRSMPHPPALAEVLHGHLAADVTD